MDRRGIFGDRRTAERREGPAFRPTDQDRRRGRDRRGPERRAEELEDRRRQHDRRRRPTHEPAASRHHIDWAALPPVSRLVPAAVVVAISLVDLGVSQTTSSGGWTFLVVLLAIPVAAFALTVPRRWWGLASAWVAVVLYAMAVGVHIAYLLTW